jgi:antibiotic biosynthesis monooxygenase (ABM) superfamily enzyme
MKRYLRPLRFASNPGTLKKESSMSVKIIIKRKVPKDKEKELLPLIKKMRILTTKQPGYISGETMNRVDKPGQSLVISTWQTRDEWQRWLNSPERKTIQDQIDALLGEKTDYEIYGHTQ